jgi:ribonuclease J
MVFEHAPEYSWQWAAIQSITEKIGCSGETLEKESGSHFHEWLSGRQIPLTLVHRSGHASVAALERLATAMSPRDVVPVHTRHADRYKELFPNVCKRSDGECWSV